MKRTVPALFVVFGAACSSSATIGSAQEALEPSQIPAGISSSLSTTVLAALQLDGPTKREQTWNISSDNALDDGWILQTPPAQYWGVDGANFPIAGTCTSGANCDVDFGLFRCATQADCSGGGICTTVAATVRAPGGTPEQLCVGHSDVMYDNFYGVITSAQRFVDVTSLSPPDGRFQAAVRNAISYLGNSGRAVTVRLLFGDYPIQDDVNSKTVLQTLTRDVPATSPLDVYVGNYRSSDVPPSWNHSKMVGADENLSIVGGENMWTADYLGIEPVHDISMRLRGTATADVHRFANEQWQYTCANRSLLTWLTWSVWSNGWRAGQISNACAPQYSEPANAVGPGNATVISIGRLAEIDPSGQSNQSDAAIRALVGAAQSTIRMSLQDLGPPEEAGIALGSWPDPLFAKLGAALVRGVDVYIVVSNPTCRAGGLSPLQAQYANGWTVAQVAQKIRDYMIANPVANQPAGDALRALLCQKLHVTSIRFSASGTWPGGVTAANHAKLVFVDDQAFYIGSQNEYVADLTELGYLVDDKRAAAQLAADYWAPLWQYSQVDAVSGTEAAQCVL